MRRFYPKQFYKFRGDRQTGSSRSSRLLEAAITIIVFGGVVALVNSLIAHNTAPKLAAEILKQQNFTNDKKEVFRQTFELTYRHIASEYLYDISKMPVGLNPNNLENNMCLIKLYIYSTDTTIPTQFKKIIQPLKKDENIITETVKLFNSLSVEVGGKPLFKESDFEFIMNTDSLKTSLKRKLGIP
jgi:hypothetical protein